MPRKRKQRDSDDESNDRPQRKSRQTKEQTVREPPAAVVSRRPRRSAAITAGKRLQESGGDGDEVIESNTDRLMRSLGVNTQVSVTAEAKWEELIRICGFTKDQMEAVDNLEEEDFKEQHGFGEKHVWKVPEITSDSSVLWIFGVTREEAFALKQLGIYRIGDLLALEDSSTQKKRILQKLHIKPCTTCLEFLISLQRSELLSTDTFLPHYLGHFVLQRDLREFPTVETPIMFVNPLETTASPHSNYFRSGRMMQLISHAHQILNCAIEYHIQTHKKLELNHVSAECCDGDCNLSEKDCLLRQANIFSNRQITFPEMMRFDVLPYESFSTYTQKNMEFVLDFDYVVPNNLVTIEKTIKLNFPTESEMSIRGKVAQNSQAEFDPFVWATTNPQCTMEKVFNEVAVCEQSLVFIEETSRRKHLYQNCSLTFQRTIEDMFAAQKISRGLLENAMDIPDRWIILERNVEIQDRNLRELLMNNPHTFPFLRIKFASRARIASDIIEEFYTFIPNELQLIISSYLVSAIDTPDEFRPTELSIVDYNSFYNQNRKEKEKTENDQPLYFTVLLSERKFFEWCHSLPEKSLSDDENHILGAICLMWEKSLTETTFLKLTRLPSSHPLIEQVLGDVDTWLSRQFIAKRLRRDLFQYQKRTVFLMANLEEHILKSTEGRFRIALDKHFFWFRRTGNCEVIPALDNWTSSTKGHASSTNVLLNPILGHIGYVDHGEINEQGMPQITCKGGILADEVGLGTFPLEIFHSD
jgi:hypothetical protein